MVPLYRAGNLETWRAEQPDPFPDRAGDRDHGLGGDQAVVTGAAVGRLGDAVAEEVNGTLGAWMSSTEFFVAIGI